MENEDNRVLADEVSKEKLKDILASFHKEKIIGLDGWGI